MSRRRLAVVPERTSSRVASSTDTPGDVTPLTAEDTLEMELWAVRVAAGEVPPREVGERLRAILGRVRATLALRPAAPPVDEGFLTVKEAAVRLNCKPEHVYHLRYSKQLPPDVFCKVGKGTVRLRADRLQAWLDAGGYQGA